MSQPCDILVFGATSFVGKILTRYLWQHYSGDSTLHWGIAGRSETRLLELRSSLGEAAADLPLIVADASDEADMRALCEQARVIVSTVGPYALYGETLVKACADTGTDYCDITGEAHWVRRMIERYQANAAASGARIVNCCGFDSIPSDMGVWHLQQQALADWSEPCSHIQGRVTALKGGMSGGTVASIINLAREAASDPALRRELADPYSLCPPGHGQNTRQVALKGPHFDADFKAWTAPFVMASINTRVVHRSNALADYAYGERFRYDEATLTGAGIKGRLRALAITAGTGAMLLGAATAPTRSLLERYVVPKPGEGPSEQQQRLGYFRLDFLGHGPDGQTLKTRVRGDGDPGYQSTAKMLGQAAICLAQEISTESRPGGFWTPATIFGQKLVDRLQSHADFTFETTF